MFIIITKKHLKITFLLFLFASLLALIVKAHESWDRWAIHPHMPDSDTDDWNYQSVFDPFEPAQTGCSVFIDLDRRILILYENGKEIRSWPVSGGSRQSPSPTGSWLVAGIGNWGKGFGGSWIALNVPWGKYGIHGTVEPWAVGSDNISHGCIRMKNEDVAELKAYMSVNVPVYIKHDDAPFRALMHGKAGSDVLRLQVMLLRLGYFEGIPDGRFGNETHRALCRFQADEQMKADGIAGQNSWSLLRERVSELYNYSNGNQ